MTQLVSSALALALVALFLSPIAVLGGTNTEPSVTVQSVASLPVPALKELVFPEPLDSSVSVPEYPVVSRALMLSGGSSDVVLKDLNGDGLSDLVVSVYESLQVSVFYRRPDGTFATYPSLNITTTYYPLSARTADIYGSGHHQIVTLERNPAFSATRLAIYNLTSETTYERWFDLSTYSNGVAFVVGHFSADSYADLAVVCEGPTPQTTAGKLEVFYGPDFSTFELLTAGLGPRSIVSGDFDSDGRTDIAVGNYFSKNVMIFEWPLEYHWNSPASTLTLPSSPTSLSSGSFNDDGLDDLVVGTEEDVSLRFYYQTVGGLPAVDNLRVAIPYAPTQLASGLMDGDALPDLLVLSKGKNLSFGHIRSASSPFWRDTPDFIMPCGGQPRAAVIGDLDGDAKADIAIASARSDWSGASLAIYPSRSPGYSNSNATVWTRLDVRPTCISSGDINGDDVADLVFMTPSNMSIGYILSFEQPVGILQLGHVPKKMLVKDFNGDGADDVLIAMADGPLLTIAYGGPSFPHKVVEIACGGLVTQVESGDFNHDGLPDFVLSADDGRIDIYFNNGTESPFGPAHEVLPAGGAGIWSLAVGDFNSDGLDDIAYPRPIRRISVLLQDRAIPFGVSSPSYTLTYPTGGDFTSVWSGDLNGDGRSDIAAMRPSDPAVYLFDQNEFTTTRTSYGTLVFPEEPMFVVLADFTDDGPADFVVLFESADLLFLYRQSSGVFPATPSMVFVTGARPTCAIIGDGTRDHRGDLLVNNAGSHSVSVWQQINFPPVARAGGPYHARQGDPLQLNGSAETGTSEMPYMEYRWDFGDGNRTDWIRQPRPTHTYIALGIYTIEVDVRDPAGLTSSDSTYVIVEDSYPHVAFSWTPAEPKEGQLVTFTDETRSFDPVVDKAWTVNGIPLGAFDTISMEFQNGTQNVTLSATDSDGSVASLTRFIDVGSMPPNLTMVAPSEACEGTEVEFHVLVDEWHGSPVDPIVSYEWDFDYVNGSFVPDPATPNSSSASHVFIAKSYCTLYTVAVRVTDSDGMTSTEVCQIYIFDAKPVAGIQINTTDPREGVPFVFMSNSTSFDGIVNWTWTLKFPDGSKEVFWLDDREMALHEFDYIDDGSYTMTLVVREADGNSSSAKLDFEVREMPPVLVLSVTPEPDVDGFYEEFTEANFTCLVEGIDEGVLWEWDFDSAEYDFEADVVTTTGSVSHVYGQIGFFNTTVRVHDSDGSIAEQTILIRVKQKPINFELYVDITITRDPLHTEIFTFNFTRLALKHPDLHAVVMEYGDGWFNYVYGPDFAETIHGYAPGRDYQLNVTMVDDDGYLFSASTMIYVVPPKIELIEPFDGAVVRSGTTILFLVTPGSTAVESVCYSINGEGFQQFSSQYLINTSGWAEADYTIDVVARDFGGNIVRLEGIDLSIDDFPPFAVIHSEKTKVYAGSRFTITVWVADRNVEASGVALYVMLPGEKVFMQYPMSEANGGNFVREFEAPLKSGRIEFFAKVTDLAGNSVVTSSYSLEVRVHLLTVALPYLLTASLVGVFGVAGYMVRESRIAVDEAFVIHNDGRMISHSTRRLKPGMDDQVLSGMFTAIQDFVKESFKDITSFTLRKIEFGEKSVLIEKGSNVYLAVILHGYASKKVAAKMQRVLNEIESKYGEHLKDWDGDLEKLRGINEISKGIYSKAPLVPRIRKHG